jgi:hypothetical protein
MLPAHEGIDFGKTRQEKRRAIIPKQAVLPVEVGVVTPWKTKNVKPERFLPHRKILERDAMKYLYGLLDLSREKDIRKVRAHEHIEIFVRQTFDRDELLPIYGKRIVETVETVRHVLTLALPKSSRQVDINSWIGCKLAIDGQEAQGMYRSVTGKKNPSFSGFGYGHDDFFSSMVFILTAR